MTSLAFEASGEAFGDQPTVLSCGGIFIPRRKLSIDLKSWKQIVNLPGRDLSAKIFGFAHEMGDELKMVLQKEAMN